MLQCQSKKDPNNVEKWYLLRTIKNIFIVLKGQYFSVPHDSFGMVKVDVLGFDNPIRIEL